MSFSSDVKEELSKQISKSRHCRIAELAAILAMEGQISFPSMALTLQTASPLVCEKYELLMKRVFPAKTVLSGDTQSDIQSGTQSDIQSGTQEDIRAGTQLVLQTLKMKDVMEITRLLKLRQAASSYSLRGNRTDGLLLMNTCCKRAFLRGAFLAGGSISNPEKSYHLEIVCFQMSQAEQIQSLMESFQMEAKIVFRKNHPVVYLKDGSQIVDMLNVMEAYVSLMKLENIRILKEISNSVNRQVNCETANIGKTVNAAVRQIEEIKKIQNRIGLDQLPEPLEEIALLRLEHRECSLEELGTYLDPPVGKSGVNHRLRKLSAIANNLR